MHYRIVSILFCGMDQSCCIRDKGEPSSSRTGGGVALPLQYNTEQTRNAIKQEEKKRMKSIDFVRKPVLFSNRRLS